MNVCGEISYQKAKTGLDGFYMQGNLFILVKSEIVGLKRSRSVAVLHSGRAPVWFARLPAGQQRNIPATMNLVNKQLVKNNLPPRKKI